MINIGNEDIQKLREKNKRYFMIYPQKLFKKSFIDG